MNLTEFQKDVVKAISLYEVSDVTSFYTKYLSIRDIEDVEYTKAFGEGCKVVIDLSDTRNKIFQFVSLWDMLKKDFYVIEMDAADYSYSDTIFIPPPRLLAKNDSGLFYPPDLKFFHVNYSKRYIVPGIKLFDFINDGYITFEENQYSEERKGRVNSMGWTKFTAIMSIIIGFGTAIFNYITYTNIREVKITNMPKNDTIKTVIVTVPLSSAIESKTNSLDSIK